jgi:hypothetical protein
VTGGNVFARLLANGGASAMPGFTSSNATVPTPGQFTTWTMTWLTGASEPLAGSAIVVDLSVGGGDGSTSIEAFFDNVVVTTAVPEPAGVSLMAFGAIVVLRRRVRDRRSI